MGPKVKTEILELSTVLLLISIQFRLVHLKQQPIEAGPSTRRVLVPTLDTSTVNFHLRQCKWVSPYQYVWLLAKASCPTCPHMNRVIYNMSRAADKKRSTEIFKVNNTRCLWTEYRYRVSYQNQTSCAARIQDCVQRVAMSLKFAKRIKKERKKKPFRAQQWIGVERHLLPFFWSFSWQWFDQESDLLKRVIWPRECDFSEAKVGPNLTKQTDKKLVLPQFPLLEPPLAMTDTELWCQCESTHATHVGQDTYPWWFQLLCFLSCFSFSQLFSGARQKRGG